MVVRADSQFGFVTTYLRIDLCCVASQADAVPLVIEFVVCLVFGFDFLITAMGLSYEQEC